MDEIERLKTAPESAVRAILIALCNDSSNHRTALQYLKSIEALDGAGNGQPQAAAQPAEPAKPSLKRKAEHEVKICIQCQDAFYEDLNSDNACQYHEGELEPDYQSDFWADHDENCHGIIDAEEMRKEYPDGFVWDCCNKLGTAPGCTRGPHEAVQTTRGRYGDPHGLPPQTREELREIYAAGWHNRRETAGPEDVEEEEEEEEEEENDDDEDEDDESEQ